ncbi:3-methyl-2-oxobutanoate hydroxymethyltransferase [Leptospira ilyithenensis]|uniref:3-methyl-2-oxobutanoate hydroxymethyltransferase n=1 Tax=Leptospira ilyithenensis TaxID=2484901 RepID=A0A4V3JWL3_9LEPT|nr:3-methyl-2-oxobutanoate hydroxymethyltransferase [Leptospira ilyithenensis]TGN06518.1 3-methyl-2-oxobutanoate hydroxymethyltransferase [Leptospira ilyithenensis]
MKNIILEFKKKRETGIPISVITCYDYSFARVFAQTEIDSILVGDSMGMVIQGHGSTMPVTLEDIIYHTKAVCKGAQNKPIIADMPFLSYQTSVEDGIRAAGTIMKETTADCVKLEGDSDLVIELTHRLNEMGVPVMSHLGLTPQSFNTLGGYKVQGKTPESRARMIQKSKELVDAGAFSVLLEMIPESLGKEITESISVPTIGIGAGRHTSGQVLVMQDLLGMNDEFHPKFLKKYANLAGEVKKAVGLYHDDVVKRAFPEEENAFGD